jgi:hypothetical protein
MAGLGNRGQGLFARQRPSAHRHKRYVAGGCGDDAAEFKGHQVSVGLYLRPDK